MSTPRNVPASIATPTAPVPAGGAPLASTLRAPFRHVPIPRSRRTRRARGQHPPDHPPTGGNSPCRARRPMAKPTDSDHEEEGNGASRTTSCAPVALATFGEDHHLARELAE